MPQKKVRVKNATNDVPTMRALIVHLDPNIEAIFDVAQGTFVQNNHMSQGHRGVIVWDDFSEEIILTSSFELTTQNVTLTISGDAASGYTMTKAAFI